MWRTERKQGNLLTDGGECVAEETGLWELFQRANPRDCKAMLPAWSKPLNHRPAADKNPRIVLHIGISGAARGPMRWMQALGKMLWGTIWWDSSGL